MPFEMTAPAPRRIAVVGGGISGLGAAHALAPHHRVTLFEAGPRLGGHARTVLAGRRGDQPVDTGFIVFNRVNYPLLCRLFADLDVPVAPSSMSFGASFDGGRLEYGLKDLPAVLTQKRNLARPAFLGMIRDIFRFNVGALKAADDPAMTVADLLARLGTGAWFRERYLLPLAGAIWSTPKERVLAFPAQAMVRFFDNHALLGATGQHAWLTVRGGSRAYVERLEARLVATGTDIRLGAPVAGIRRHPGGAEIRTAGGEWESFDDIILATHADAALGLLADADAGERAALGAIHFQPNRAVLHADASLMPRRRRAWASWVYTERAGRAPGEFDLTYWMNSLQPIPQEDPLFVTLNPTRPIDERLVYDETEFRHPVYDRGVLAAQAAIRAMNGKRRTWFCGAWMRNGFHEDGLASGVAVARAIGRPALPLAWAAE